MEQNPALNPISAGRCDNLRWKGLLLGDETPQADSICWCLETQIGIGPDGQLVDRYECNPGRGCFRAL